MSHPPEFYLQTPLAKGLAEFFGLLEKQMELDRPLAVYLAGGMAVHLYTAARVTTDIDAEFGARVLLPQDLLVQVQLEDGSYRSVHLDTNYNSTFALMHESYQDDAIPVDLGLKWLKVMVLSPVDMVVSKISRFAQNDQEDIQSMVLHGLVRSDEIESRALHAMGGYIGNKSMVLLNLRDALALAREVEARGGQPSAPGVPRG